MGACRVFEFLSEDGRKETIIKYAKDSLYKIDVLVDRVKVIYTDMDGTLVNPSGCIFQTYNGKLSLEPAKAVTEVLKSEKDVVIISGRTRTQLKENARMLGFKNFIAELGCEIVYGLGKKVVYNLGEIRVEGEKPLAKIEKMGIVDLIFDKFPGRIRYYTPWSENVETHPLLVGQVDVGEADEFLKKQGFGSFKMRDNGEVPPEPDFKKPHCYHLLPETSGKKTAVKKDKAIRNLKKEEIVGIGESLEDMEISSEAGVYFVVKNGAESDPRVGEAIKQSKNVFLLERRMGEGWAEAIEILRRMGKL